MDYIAEQLRPLAIPIGSVNPDAANARKHGEANMAAIVASLSRFGQRAPIVVQRKGMVVRAGNGRLAAAKSLGWSHIAAVVVDDESVEAVAFAIADNRTAELAEWDKETLASLLNTMDADSLKLTGFNDADLAGLLGELAPEIVEDVAPDPQPEAITKTGDLWLLGDHRLLCGDGTRAEDVARVLNGTSADMVLTDPPYGVAYVGKTDDALPVHNDDVTEEELSAMVAAAFGHAHEASRPGAYWYATVPSRPLHLVFANEWKRLGVLRQVLVWVKDSMVLGHSEYHYQHEPILFGWKQGGKRHPNDDRTRTSVWSVDRPKASREHPTTKPVELWSLAMKDGSRTGEIVYDPFLGSGTTMVTAEQLGRKCYGIEISPQYCDVIVKRWETLTGKKAVLEST